MTNFSGWPIRASSSHPPILPHVAASCRVLCFFCGNRIEWNRSINQEKDDWIGAIGRAIVQASSTYQGDNNNGDSDSEDDYDYR